MIAEQLQAARAAHWRQKQNPILTLDDAQNWLREHSLCLYLPRHAQLPAPAPSFVEACMGNRHATPNPAAIEQARGLLTRLIESGTVVPLNLFGAVGEQPDFLAHSEALPYVLALRADPDWKHAPQKTSGHKVSPLVLELWKAVDKEGVLTAAEARETLGRELTEAAVLRALCELWQGLRITPVYAGEGQPARWEMMRVRHREALATAGATGQVTALSLLVSMYLQSVYAASSEEIEIFLSPVASRSRVREAVRGLSATRQIHSLSMDAQTYHFLENGLPEFAELAAPAEQPAQVSGRPAPAPRKVQATRPPGQAFPVAPAAGSAPIFRRPKPEPKPAPVQPTARTDWKSNARPPAKAGPPVRPGSEFRKPWQDAAKPPASGASWKDKDGGARAGGKARPASGARPPFPPARTYSPGSGGREETTGKPARRAAAGGGTRPYAKPGGARAGGRAGARPEARGAGRANARPGAWAGPARRETPKPWALPGRKTSAATRPARAGGRGDSPFRPPPKPRDRPFAGGAANTGTAREGAEPFRPRAPRGERGPGDPSRARSSGAPGRPPGRTAGSPSAYRANRPSAPAAARPPGRPPTGIRPYAARSAEGRSPRPERFDQSSRPSPRPSGGKDGASPRTGPPRYDRPRPGGYAKSRPSPGAGDKAARPPFAQRSGPARSGPPRTGQPGSGKPRSGQPRSGQERSGQSGSRPPGSGSRAGSSARKPPTGKPPTGKPPASFRGRKPDRKKPEA